MAFEFGFKRNPNSFGNVTDISIPAVAYDYIGIVKGTQTATLFLDLLLSVINVSVQTVEIVKELPKLKL